MKFILVFVCGAQDPLLWTSTTNIGNETVLQVLIQPLMIAIFELKMTFSWRATRVFWALGHFKLVLADLPWLTRPLVTWLVGWRLQIKCFGDGGDGDGAARPVQNFRSDLRTEPTRRLKSLTNSCYVRDPEVKQRYPVQPNRLPWSDQALGTGPS